MITASTFSRLYSSFWRDVAPTTELFVRRVNLGQYERDFPEMTTSTEPMRRGVINELAFALFCESVKRQKRWPSAASDLTLDEIRAVAATLPFLAANKEVGRATHPPEPNDEEIADIREQHVRMMRVFTHDYSPSDIVIEPAFPGCGIIDTCKGDLLVSTTLFEVKAGDRSFRSVDVRQLITYVTLNQISKRFVIDRVGLFNPRVGIRREINLENLCFEISGKKSVELLSEITLAISSGEISR